MKQKFVRRMFSLALTVTMALSPMVVSASSNAGSNTGSNPGVSEQTAPASVKKSTGHSKAKSTAVTQNNIVIGSNGVINSTIAGNYSVKGVNGLAVTTPMAEVFAAADCKKGEYVYVIARDSACGDLAKASLKSAAAALNAPEGPMVDFYMIKASASESSEVEQLGTPISMTVGIPANLRSADRDFAMIRVVKGGEIKVLVDNDSDDSTISILTDKTGVYMLTYGPKGYFDELR